MREVVGADGEAEIVEDGNVESDELLQGRLHVARGVLLLRIGGGVTIKTK
jgi:hypothetical protein